MESRVTIRSDSCQTSTSIGPQTILQAGLAAGRFYTKTYESENRRRENIAPSKVTRFESRYFAEARRTDLLYIKRENINANRKNRCGTKRNVPLLHMHTQCNLSRLRKVQIKARSLARFASRQKQHFLTQCSRVRHCKNPPLPLPSPFRNDDPRL